MKALRLTTLFVVVSLSIAEAIPPVSAAPGDLDLTFGGFGTDGKVIQPGLFMPPPGGPWWVDNQPRGMVLQPDGKIVVAGYTGFAALVMRYLPNGVLDSTFGNNGIALIENEQYAVRAHSVVIQPADGKIVIAGWADADFLLLRLTAAGVLDTSFGTGGFVRTDFDADADQAYAVVIQSDGKIIAGGRAKIDGDYDFAAARYYPDGTLDTTFGGDGKATVPFGRDEGANDIALQSDGKLVLVGGDHNWNHCVILSPIDSEFEVARLDQDGTLDTSFNFDGKVVTGLGSCSEHASAVTIQPDGKIVVVGDDIDGIKMARYHPNGSLDDSFDGDGLLSIGSLSGHISDVALQRDGKIVLLGYHESPDHSYKFAFYRLHPNGSLDNTFDHDGRAFLELDAVGRNDQGHAVVLQSDGRIVGYGSTDRGHALVRLWPDGTLDTGGKQTLSFADIEFELGADEEARGVAVQPDGKIIVAGYIGNADASQTNIALARFLPDGQLDMSFGLRGRVIFPDFVKSVASSVVLQPDGKIVVAGYMRQGSVTNFLVVRFNNNGTLDTSFYSGFGYNVADFAGGDDIAYALALAPDGKIVLAGTAWNGARSVFGVARFNSNGHLDNTFDGDGKAYFDTLLSNWASAVVVQRDRRIVVGGHIGYDFALVRFREDGLLDYGWGPGGQGWTATDMGGVDVLKGLAINAGGWFYAAGSRFANGHDDFAVAQFRPNGVLATCTGLPCDNWSTGKAYADWGGQEIANAIDVRNDGQIVVAGSVGGQFGWAQFNPTTALSPLLGVTDFVVSSNIYAVQFAGPNKIIAAGTQDFNTDSNFALARFETRAFNPRFTDVPTTHVFWQQIEAIFTYGITSGCQVSPRLYCSDDSVTRAQMAVFLLRAKYGPAYQPPAASCVNGHSSNFTDVACPDVFANFIEQLRAEGVTSGCGTNLYCPNNAVTRAQMAVFLLRTKYGSNYTPPPATGIFTDVPDDFFRPWIEQLAREGITAGCGTGVYCPNNPVTRAQMAAFLVRTLNLPLP